MTDEPLPTNEVEPADPHDAVEATSQAMNEAVTAVEQLEDASDEVLLRHVVANTDGGVSNETDLSLYSASVFLLQERGYETDTEDGRLVVFDSSGEPIDLASFGSDG